MLGESIRKKRIEKALNMREFAKTLGISPSKLSDIEHNYIEAIPYDLLKRIALLLDFSFDELLKMPLVSIEKQYKADFICTSESIRVLL